jgi:hypothetical protein
LALARFRDSFARPWGDYPMRILRLTALATALGLFAAAGALSPSAAQAQDEANAPAQWHAYQNADFHVSVQVPAATSEKFKEGDIDGVNTRSVIALMSVGGRGAFVVTVVDFSAVAGALDVDSTLEKSVQRAVAGSGSTLDTSNRITVDGAPGRDVTFHSDMFVGKARLVLANKRLYGLVGAGPKADGVPVEYERFIHSLKILP